MPAVVKSISVPDDLWAAFESLIEPNLRSKQIVKLIQQFVAAQSQVSPSSEDDDSAAPTPSVPLTTELRALKAENEALKQKLSEQPINIVGEGQVLQALQTQQALITSLRNIIASLKERLAAYEAPAIQSLPASDNDHIIGNLTVLTRYGDHDSVELQRVRELLGSTSGEPIDLGDEEINLALDLARSITLQRV